MTTITIWKLSTFCGFYGKVIPHYINGWDGVFKSFHTSTRNPDVDDLEIVFEPNLEPMTFIDLISMSNSNLYIMGHGHTWQEYSGKCFYANYTMYSEEGLKKYFCNKFTEEKCKGIWEKLTSINQTIISLD